MVPTVVYPPTDWVRELRLNVPIVVGGETVEVLRYGRRLVAGDFVAAEFDEVEEGVTWVIFATHRTTGLPFSALFRVDASDVPRLNRVIHEFSRSGPATGSSGSPSSGESSRESTS
jgi:hypothetical protein